MGEANLGHITSGIAARFEQARREAGLSQIQVARVVGVTQSLVSDWEKGISSPRADQLVMIAGKLGRDAAWILTGESMAGGTEEAALSARSALRQAIIALERLEETYAAFSPSRAPGAGSREDRANLLEETGTSKKSPHRKPLRRGQKGP